MWSHGGWGGVDLLYTEPSHPALYEKGEETRWKRMERIRYHLSGKALLLLAWPIIRFCSGRLAILLFSCLLQRRLSRPALRPLCLSFQSQICLVHDCAPPPQPPPHPSITPQECRHAVGLPGGVLGQRPHQRIGRRGPQADPTLPLLRHEVRICIEIVWYTLRPPPAISVSAASEREVGNDTISNDTPSMPNQPGQDCI